MSKEATTAERIGETVMREISALISGRTAAYEHRFTIGFDTAEGRATFQISVSPDDVDTAKRIIAAKKAIEPQFDAKLVKEKAKA